LNDWKLVSRSTFSNEKRSEFGKKGKKQRRDEELNNAKTQAKPHVGSTVKRTPPKRNEDLKEGGKGDEIWTRRWASRVRIARNGLET